jgi:flagellin-like protein
MKLGKRGIAPVISTLLLIMFASALGIIVMTWGRTSSVVADTADCTDTSLNIIKYNQRAHVCYQGGEIFYTLENNGHTDIRGVRAIVISSFNIQQIDIPRPMHVADIVRNQIPYDPESQGDIQKIKFVPKIYVDELKLCPNNGVEIDNIVRC